MPIALLPLGLVATRSRVRVRRIAAAVVFGLHLCVTARAIEQQARPVTVLVGFAPGGVPDLVARVFAEKLQERLERTFIVENRTSHLAEPHRQGRLRILATTGTRRNALLAEVPTVAELGYARATSEEWFAFFARAGTPATETLVFAQAVQDLVALPDVQASLQKHGLTPVAKLSAELRQDIVAGTVRWARIARDIGFRLDN